MTDSITQITSDTSNVPPVAPTPNSPLQPNPLAELATNCTPNWCAGCGNFPLWAAYKNAAVQKSWNNTNSVMVAGIGCHGHIVNFTKLTSFEGLHGRPLPVASAIKMVNHRLNVFVFTGDGDCFGEGGNHFIHACRRNHDIKVFLHDNGLYALTTGQTSPLSPHGFKTKSTPAGNPDEPILPTALAIAAGATFVARGYAGDIPHLTELMKKATEHRGFALIDILQPCITYNKEFTHTFYQENTYQLDSNYDPTNKGAAFIKAMEFGPKQIPLGIIYQTEKPTYESYVPQIAQTPLIDQPVDARNTSELLKKFI